MTAKKTLVTTAIDYTNDVIHVGHAYEKILADCVARFLRLKNGEENVYFVTGTDEHGTTNEKAAKKAGIPTKEFVDTISKQDKEQIDALNVSYNRFIRTTDKDHEKIVLEFFEKALKTRDVYKGTYKGLYCDGCESYKTLNELDEKGRCVLHPTREIQKIEEENYFFRWSKYSDFLKELIKNSPKFIQPFGAKREMLAFLEKGLVDIPVSRPKYKVPWGIEVPGDASQVIYVWYDALTNYYTAGIQNGFWGADTKVIHFVGKDIVRFHALLWPAMLKNVGYKLPDVIYSHGFINLNGEKISKSRGNVIKPTDLVKQFGADAVRYYFLRYGPITGDVNISLEHLKKIYNADLANGLGNAVTRLAKLAQNSELAFAPLKLGESLWDEKWAKPFEDFRVDLVLQNVWARLSDLDKHINENAPWEIKDKSKLTDVLGYEINELRKIASIIEPFIPSTSKIVREQFCDSKITATPGLFPRIN